MDRNRCVAVVGVACRFPGGEMPEEFWDSLLSGKNFVKEIPPDRWNVDAFYSPDKDGNGKTDIRHADLLDE